MSELEIVERLRRREQAFGWHNGKWCEQTNPDGIEAAALIEELVAALDPFARAAAIQHPHSENWPDDKPNIEFLPQLWPDWADFRRARSILTKIKGGEHG